MQTTAPDCYREEHSSVLLHVCGLNHIVPPDEVVFDVAVEGTEGAAAEAGVLELLPEGQRAQPGLREGLAHGPGSGRWRLPRGRVPVGSAAAAHVVELLDALVDQRGRRLLVRHSDPAAEEHFELFGEGVVEFRGAAQLLLAGDLPRLPDGTDDLRHLRERERVRDTCGRGLSCGAHPTNTKVTDADRSFQSALAATGAGL